LSEFCNCLALGFLGKPPTFWASQFSTGDHLGKSDLLGKAHRCTAAQKAPLNRPSAQPSTLTPRGLGEECIEEKLTA
jgi:hypothetical protein